MIDALGVAVGLVGGWLTGWWFYRRSNQDIARDTRNLIRHLNLILEALENKGRVKVIRNADGDVVSMLIEMAGESIGEATTTATLMGGEPAPVAPPRWAFWRRSR